MVVGFQTPPSHGGGAGGGGPGVGTVSGSGGGGGGGGRYCWFFPLPLPTAFLASLVAFLPSALAGAIPPDLACPLLVFLPFADLAVAMLQTMSPKRTNSKTRIIDSFVLFNLTFYADCINVGCVNLY